MVIRSVPCNRQLDDDFVGDGGLEVIVDDGADYEF